MFNSKIWLLGMDASELVNGCCTQHKNGDFVIAINKSISETEQREALIHELSHIFLGHLTAHHRDLKGLETEADTLTANIIAKYEIK
jgi:Zn-dependent peptidase ImmA (M78 family)